MEVGKKWWQIALCLQFLGWTWLNMRRQDTVWAVGSRANVQYHIGHREALWQAWELRFGDSRWEDTFSPNKKEKTQNLWPPWDDFFPPRDSTRCLWKSGKTSITWDSYVLCFFSCHTMVCQIFSLLFCSGYFPAVSAFGSSARFWISTSFMKRLNKVVVRVGGSILQWCIKCLL